MHSVLRILFGICWVLGPLTLGGCATAPAQPSTSLPSLVEALRAGGNVIYAQNLYHDKDGRTWKGILRDWDGGIITIPAKYYRVLKLNKIIKEGDSKRRVTEGIPTAD